MNAEEMEELLGNVTKGEWASGAQFLANEDGEFNGNEWEGPLSGEEQAMIDAAWEKHKSALTESPYLARRVLAAEKMAEALDRIEDACNKLASTRTHDVYLSMIDSGQSDYLIELDNARKNARAALTAYREASK